MASAFVNHMRGSEPESRLGPRVWAVALVVLLVGGVEVGIARWPAHRLALQDLQMRTEALEEWIRARADAFLGGGGAQRR